eukprot:GHVU01128445.1.p1 GENE.GHVU01128445.1~~GHVU01128445.1.p1  ORF type:complete len:276 (-),score=29.82 GHVU01128445.1:197-1024(-)
MASPRRKGNPVAAEIYRREQAWSKYEDMGYGPASPESHMTSPGGREESSPSLSRTDVEKGGMLKRLWSRGTAGSKKKVWFSRRCSCFKGSRSRTAAFLILLAAIGLAAVLTWLFYAYLLKSLVQRTIDKSKLNLHSVALTDPSQDGVNIRIQADLSRNLGIKAVMHDLPLTVYYVIPRSLSVSDPSKYPPGSEHRIGRFTLPAFTTSGRHSPINATAYLHVDDMRNFQEFTKQFVAEGDAQWRLVGLANLTVLGKDLTGIRYNKVLPLSGEGGRE